MSEHTPGRLEVLDDRRISVTLPPLIEGCGYTSHCVAMAYGGDERVNSHANARRLAASWNACDGFETDLLENIVMTGGTLKSRFALRTQEERESKAESDSLRAVNAELLEALEKSLAALEKANKEEFGPISDTIWFSEYETLFDFMGAAIASARKGEQG